MSDTSGVNGQSCHDSIDAADVLSLLEEVQTRLRKGPKVVDQRGYARYPFNSRIVLHHSDLEATENGLLVGATGRDISLWGIGLDSPEPFDVGSYVLIDFRFPNNEKIRIVRMLGEVCHVTEAAPRNWIIGCAFRETVDSFD